MSSRLALTNAYSYVLEGATGFQAGAFQYDAVADRWDWSDDVYEIHGFTRGEIVPTTKLVLAHKHPDDRAPFEAVLRNALTGGSPVVSHHRIVDAHGATRYIMMVAEGTYSTSGDVIGLSGYFIDLTAVREHETRAVADEAVARSAEHRGIIEQAKGWLMATRGVDAEAAFTILSEISQSSNTKLFAVAEALIHHVEAESVPAAGRNSRPVASTTGSR
ncbi:PAS and ANTAR domain-containing protein [Spelaeicoccus albus]|uniref:histidine kinase n=1 Tax=Spelaeicoccus albus TaxID=1280376 RepID=A0A7Z0IIS3_9MICO|nr:PAS and ANTAR domain-containing protein [Spelaeicoccus albus]NYI68749.1 PAS domain S-box-containing protein [Spelaeicoccus albus]